VFGEQRRVHRIRVVEIDAHALFVRKLRIILIVVVLLQDRDVTG
jgi:hypothetical protein